MEMARGAGRSTLKMVAAGAAATMLLAVLALSALWITPSDANPYFQSRTGRNCADCHLPGQEMRGPSGLNSLGRGFHNAFRRCAECALRDYAANRHPSQRSGAGNLSGGGSCSKFSCNNHNVCHFRIRFGNGGSRQITIRRGENYTVRNLHRGDRWCFIEPNGVCEMKGIKLQGC
jgi:hypothetical protein